MKQRMSSYQRRRVTEVAVKEEGRAVGRDGWVTMTMVAHEMELCPSSYVMKILTALLHGGRIHRRTERRRNGAIVYKFRHPTNSHLDNPIPF